MTRRIFAYAAALAAGAGGASADVINNPAHPHTGPNIVTSGTGPAELHQHRTAHDVATNGTYIANKAWVNNTFHSSLSTPAHTEWGHGHMDERATYAIQTATAGGSITTEMADAWNTNAATVAQRAFNIWNGAATGHGVGERNNPTGDTIPGSSTPEVLVHSSINFQMVQPNQSPDILILLDPAEAALGSFSSADRRIRFNPNPISGQALDWYFGTSTSTSVEADKYDGMTVMLHESGHAIGFAHWGSRAGGNIMDITNTNGLGLRGGSNNIVQNIGADEIHGARDIYSIPGTVPAPGVLALLGFGGMLSTRRRRTE